MRYWLLLAVGTGCSVDVGAGSIDPVAFDAPIDPALMSPPVSLDMETDFLTAEQSQWFDDQYGNKLGAVSAVDVAVQTLDITDASGTPVAGSVFILGFEGVTIDHAGERVRLPDATRKKILAAVAQRAAMTVTVHVTLGWSMSPPPVMGAHVVLQPIVVVDALKAL